MSDTKLIQYIHRPNVTELGMGNTHETYMLINSGMDLSCVFPHATDVLVRDMFSGKRYALKSSIGREFRVNQMGELYRDYNVCPGDEIIITQIECDTFREVLVNVKLYNRVVFSVGANGTEIFNLERLKEYAVSDRKYSIILEENGVKKTLVVEFESSKKKRVDSPDTTDYYSAYLNDENLERGTYYLTISKASSLEKKPKCEFNVICCDNSILTILNQRKDNATIDSYVLNNNQNYEFKKHFSLQQIYYGAPGTGKSHTINEQTKGESVIRTTFHPDSDYSTFVGAYKPTTIEVPMRDVTGKIIKEDGQDVTENRIVYEFVDQAFLQAYVQAWKFYADNSDVVKKQYLIIEEINRGNCAQIFGDLFQLLDRNDSGFSVYPINADKDMKKQLAKAFKKEGVTITIPNADQINALYHGKDVVSEVLSGDILVLPNNFYIWATMNTSDQSLFPIDSAFKRRWDWQYVPISDAGKQWKISVNGKRYDWWHFIQKMNDKIDIATHSEDKKLGYFFCKAKDGVIDAETFVGKVIFYIWNDVFKDFVEDAGDLFKDVDGFNKFYAIGGDGKAKVNEDNVERFLMNLGLLPDDVEDELLDDVEEDLQDEETDGNDNTKYSFDGKSKLGKGKLAVAIVEKYMKEHTNFTFGELKEVFPDSMMGNALKLKGFIVKADVVLSASERYQKTAYGVKEGRKYTDVNGVEFFVSNYWNKTNIQNIIYFAERQGWNVEIEGQ